MLLFHEVCHSSKIYLLIDGLKLENGNLKEVCKKVNEYDQEIQLCRVTLSTTRKSHSNTNSPQDTRKTITRHQVDNESETISSLFLVKMTAKLESKPAD